MRRPAARGQPRSSEFSRPVSPISHSTSRPTRYDSGPRGRTIERQRERKRDATRDASGAPPALLSFRIFRPRLFSKRMALLRPATGSLIWLRRWPSCRPVRVASTLLLALNAVSAVPIGRRYYNSMPVLARAPAVIGPRKNRGMALRVAVPTRPE